MKADLLRVATLLALLASCSVASAQDYQYTSEEAQATPVSLVGGWDCGNAASCTSCQDALACNSCGDSCSCRSLYASVNLRGSFDHLQSGGFNTVGIFPNTGSDNRDSFSIGGAIGVAIPRTYGTLRLECEGIYVDPFNTVTNSFAPPTPTFFYTATTSNRWAVLANSWFDIPLNDRLDVYVGGGIGGGGAAMAVDDGVVSGSGSSTDFVYQAGCGLNRRFDRISLDLGYRYMHWGTANVDLFANVGGGPAGNFTAEVTSHQLFFAVRFTSLGNLFSR